MRHNWENTYNSNYNVIYQLLAFGYIGLLRFHILFLLLFICTVDVYFSITFQNKIKFANPVHIIKILIKVVFILQKRTILNHLKINILLIFYLIMGTYPQKIFLVNWPVCNTYFPWSFYLADIKFNMIMYLYFYVDLNFIDKD